MKQMNEMSARALSMEELENVNGGIRGKHSISKIKPRECPLIKFKGRSFFFFHDIIHDLCSNGRLRFRYFRFAVHLSPLLALC